MSRPPRVHPPGDVIADYMAGQLHRFERWLIEAHLEWCSTCRGLAASGARIGGEWLMARPEDEDPGLPNELWQRLETKLDREALAGSERREVGAWPGVELPRSIRHELRSESGGVSWMPVGESSSQIARVGGDAKTERELYLVRTPAGGTFPRHCHLEGEDLLVLSGSLRDDYARLGAGDFWRYPAGSVHAPEIGGESECVALACVRGGLDFFA